LLAGYRKPSATPAGRLGRTGHPGGRTVFFTKAATLLVFPGIWALMRGILDIVTAFQVKSLAP